jgi:purine-binding chemotaxis protein CheW
MEIDDSTTSGLSQYLTFDLAGERYAVAVASVEVVLESTVVTRVPKSPAHLRGVINHRGSVVPVVDLRSVFGIDRSESEESSSVIVTQVEFEGERLTAGILADSVQEVVDLEQASVEPPPSFGARVDGEFIKGIAKRDGRFVILLDLERALSGATTGSPAPRAADRE